MSANPSDDIWVSAIIFGNFGFSWAMLNYTMYLFPRQQIYNNIKVSMTFIIVKNINNLRRSPGSYLH